MKEILIVLRAFAKAFLVVVLMALVLVITEVTTKWILENFGFDIWFKLILAIFILVLIFLGIYIAVKDVREYRTRKR